MSIISALHNGRQLGVPDPGFLAGCAHGSRTDPNLNNVSPGEDQSFNHVSGDYITCQNGMGREGLANL